MLHKFKIKTSSVKIYNHADQTGRETEGEEEAEERRRKNREGVVKEDGKW